MLDSSHYDSEVFKIRVCSWPLPASALQAKEPCDLDDTSSDVPLASCCAAHGPRISDHLSVASVPASESSVVLLEKLVLHRTQRGVFLLFEL